MADAEYLRRLGERPLGWSLRNETEVPAFAFEKVDIIFWQKYVGERWIWALYLGAFYVAVIFGLQRWMQDKPAMRLKKPLFWWNFSLGIFSIAGICRTLPGFLYVISQPNGFYQAICQKTNLDIPTGFWMLMFIFSKPVELGDTLFIVLRKRPLIFLQWYHHLITLIVCWILSPLVEPVSRWYAVLNFSVHSLMYPYFAARALNIRVPTKLANFITTLQFLQMIIGLVINMLSMYLTQTGHDCVRYPISIRLFSLVYGSFFLLFGKLFYDSVIKRGRKAKEARNVSKKSD